MGVVNRTILPPEPEHPVCVMKEWIAALRRKGNKAYVQTNGQLHADGAFCVWGVLCDLNAKAGGAQWKKQYPDDDIFEYRGNDSHPPAKLVRFVGMSEADRDRLIDMNDGGSSFLAIADVLEKEYLPKLVQKVGLPKLSRSS